MRALARAYDALLLGGALVAAAMLVWVMVAMVISVLMRNAGLQPFAWLFTSTEYSMLYITMLGAPWLVRERGHVHIELVIASLRDPWSGWLSRFVAAACAGVCVMLAWQGYDLVSTNIARNDFDVRAYYFPRWLLSISFPISFGLMAIEFARFVVGPRRLHDDGPGAH